MIILFALLVFSCNEKTKNEPIIDHKIENLKAKENTTNESNKLKTEEQKYIQNLEKKKNKKLDYSNNLTSDELIELLPNRIDGFETLPNSSGVQENDDGSLFTFAKAQFQNENKQNIIIDIFDYGKKGSIPNKDNYTKPPKDLDSPTIKYKDEFSTGFYTIDKHLDYGRLEVLIKNRFVVVVRLNKNIDNEKLLIEILRKVKLSKLKNIK